MDLNDLPDFRQYFVDWSQYLDSLRQNHLLDETSFLRFVNERGIQAWGVCSGDPGDFCKRGWLSSDGINYDGGPLFHPFRIYPLFKTLKACRLNIATSSTLRRDSLLGFIENVLSSFPSVEQIGEMTRQWDRVIDLAILLEPLNWPTVTGKISFHGRLRENDFDVAMELYRQKVLNMVGSLDLSLWRKIHQAIVFDAHCLDPNDKLYVLLRVGNWARREDLKGHVGGALWFRHIAEVIRRAFEEVSGEQWPEEDYATGWWPPGARLGVFGSERPYDDDLKSKPYLALEFGLFTGSLVRWYVEGETEYFVIRHIIYDPAKSGIELVNLRGNIVTDKGNIALKLRDCLKEDLALRRFSMISFDADVPANVKTIRRQVEQKHVVGFIAANNPDFEFVNFTVEELAEVAACIDEAHAFSGDPVRNADWTGVHNGRTFEQKYKALSARKPQGLKGQEWGEALADFAVKHQKRPDDGRERPLWREIRAAIQAKVASYNYQKEHCGFDLETFALIDLKTNLAIAQN